MIFVHKYPLESACSWFTRRPRHSSVIEERVHSRLQTTPISTRQFQKGVLLPFPCYLHTPWSNQFLSHENGNQLQVTTIKITGLIVSKENKPIHGLDLSSSTGPGALRLCYHVELTWLIFLWHTHRLKTSDWGCCGLNYSSAIPATSFCLSNTSSSCSRSLWSSSMYIQVHYIGYFVHCLIVITLRTMFRCWLKRAWSPTWAGNRWARNWNGGGGNSLWWPIRGGFAWKGYLF